MKKLILLLILGGIAYGSWQGYSLYEQAETAKATANQLMNEYTSLQEKRATYEAQQATLSAEAIRCTEYTAQESGNFTEFEYCKRYLELVQDLNLTN